MPVDIPIVCPVQTVLTELLAQIDAHLQGSDREMPEPAALAQWWQQIESWREAHGLWHGRRYGES